MMLCFTGEFFCSLPANFTMNVLFVVPYVPNLVRVRPYNLIRSLTHLGHRVTVLTLWTNEAEQADIEQLKQHCYEVKAVPMSSFQSMLNCIRVLPGRDPLQSVYSWQPDLVTNLAAVSDFDIVHVEHLRGARYGLHFEAQGTLPIVWDSVDCITHLFRQASAQSKNLMRRWRSRLDLSRTEWYEGWLINQFDHVLVTSATDKKVLTSLSPNGYSAPITVVPNGVDLEYFSPDTAVARDPATVMVSGKMSYHANITMTLYLVENIMPWVWQERPDVKLMIVGKDPTREIQALSQNPAITVTGTVADLPPYLQQATLAVAPVTYNAGIQNKILEAMACATPVITTLQAVSNLDVQSGRDLLVAEDVEDFSRKILSLLDDPTQRHKIGHAGRMYVERHHNWASQARKVEEIYRKAILSKRESSIIVPKTLHNA